MIKKKREKLKQKMFSIGTVHQRIIDHCILDKGMLSESDVVRQALVFYHDKMYPNYVFRASPAAAERTQQQEESHRIELLSPSGYAKEFLPGSFEMSSTDGTPYILLRVLGSMDAYPLEGIRAMIEKDKFIASIHEAECAKRGPITWEKDRFVIERLISKYNLVFKE